MVIVPSMVKHIYLIWVYCPLYITIVDRFIIRLMVQVETPLEPMLVLAIHAKQTDDNAYKAHIDIDHIYIV